MATSHMKKRLSPKKFAVLQADVFIYSWDVPETPVEDKIKTFP